MFTRVSAPLISLPMRTVLPDFGMNYHFQRNQSDRRIHLETIGVCKTVNMHSLTARAVLLTLQFIQDHGIDACRLTKSQMCKFTR